MMAKLRVIEKEFWNIKSRMSEVGVDRIPWVYELEES